MGVTGRSAFCPAAVVTLAVVVLCALAPNAIARDTGSDVLDEIGSQLRPLRSGNDAAISDARKTDVTISRAERVLVEVYVNGSSGAAVGDLREAGMSVKATADEPVSVVEGWLPVTRLTDFAKLGIVRAVLPVMGGGSDAGAATSQGVAAHRIPQAIAAGAGNGSGVDVGVISTTMSRVGGGVAASQSTGDLPPGPGVSIIKEGAVLNADDEGRAMAEVIFDGAPGINRFVFATGNNGPADKADSINQLVANGVDVIADDIFQLGEPFFQDGVVAQAVDNARAAGVTYIASAGNRARQSYEGTYSNSAGSHDFDPGAPTDVTQTLVTVPNNRFIQVAIDWDEPWGAAQTDLDAVLKQANGAALGCGTLTGGTDSNLTTHNPMEIVTWSNTCGSAVSVGLQVKRMAGTASPFMKYIARGNFGNFTIGEYATNSDAINPDAGSATGSITVAAVSAFDPGLDTPEPYSSRGPKTRLFDKNGIRLASPEVRSKPDVAASDVVSTTVPAFLSFTGTSASVPSAASIAASLISTNPNASPAEIRSQMTDPANANDCTASAVVPDPDCGAGFLFADSAAAGLDRTTPVVNAALTPAAPNGKNGWYTRTVNVGWIPSDPESTIESAPCPVVSDTTDGIETHKCEATSGGGTSTGTVEVKRDTVKPSMPKITGIKAGRYRLKGKPKLPALSKVRCKSTDATSGLSSCRITGYKRKVGKRTLTATATDKAGLKSVKKLKYKVAP